jgi:hypothetical protein
LARFLILALLTIRYGKQVVDVLANIFRTHLHWALGVLGAGAAIWLLFHMRSRRRKAQQS